MALKVVGQGGVRLAEGYVPELVGHRLALASEQLADRTTCFEPRKVCRAQVGFDRGGRCDQCQRGLGVPDQLRRVRVAAHVEVLVRCPLGKARA